MGPANTTVQQRFPIFLLFLLAFFAPKNVQASSKKQEYTLLLALLSIVRQHVKRLSAN